MKTKPYRMSISKRGFRTNTSYKVQLVREEPAHVGGRMVACICQESDEYWKTYGGESKNGKMMVSDYETKSGAA